MNLLKYLRRIACQRLWNKWIYCKWKYLCSVLSREWAWSILPSRRGKVFFKIDHSDETRFVSLNIIARNMITLYYQKQQKFCSLLISIAVTEGFFNDQLCSNKELRNRSKLEHADRLMNFDWSWREDFLNEKYNQSME